MSDFVSSTAVLTCSCGTAPSTLNILPKNRAAMTTPLANIMDYIPAVNIQPFAMCTSPSNPAVIAQQGAPATCIPATTAPWSPGSPSVFLAGSPALTNSCTLNCSWNGVITISSCKKGISIP